MKTMPQVWKIFRSKRRAVTAKKKNQVKSKKTKKKAITQKENYLHTKQQSCNSYGIFRSRKESIATTGSNDFEFSSSSEFAINEESVAFLLPTEQTPLTWTVTDDTAYSLADEPSTITTPESTKSTVVILEEDLQKIKLRHTSSSSTAVTELATEIRFWKKANTILSINHAAEIARKDASNSKMRTLLHGKEEELAMIRTELDDTREELKALKFELVKTQRRRNKLFNSHKNQWPSILNGYSIAPIFRTRKAVPTALSLFMRQVATISWPRALISLTNGTWHSSSPNKPWRSSIFPLNASSINWSWRLKVNTWAWN
jgi:hypothetical protein